MSRDNYAPKSPDLSSFYSAPDPGPTTSPRSSAPLTQHAHQPRLQVAQEQIHRPASQHPLAAHKHDPSRPLPCYAPPPPAAGPDPRSTGHSAAAQPQSLLALAVMPPRQAAPEVDPSPVRTKFPTARIKRIMQADEEVGKVAQQTPIAVGKALEMFMIAMVTKSAEVARERNSKRVSAQMLKQVVESDDQWDFLREIVAKVENEEKVAKPGAKSKAESSSEDEAPADKKKGRPGRKKKAA